MRLNDFLKEDSLEDISKDSNSNFNDDMQSKAVASYRRKPVITLRHINKLKKMIAAKIEEFEKRKPLLAMMYGSPGEE